MVRKLRAGAFVLSSKLVRTVEGKIHPTHQESFQLSEILGALSLATDLADGQPQGSAMGATVIATRIGGRLGLDRDALTELYWSVLLRFLGCTATAGQLAPAGFGVEQVLNHAFTAGDPYDAADMRRRLDAGLPLDVNPQERSARIESLAELRDGAYVFVEQHCEQAKALARRLPVPEGVPEIVSLRHSRWDGQAPMHPSADQLPLNARIMEFATAMELQRRVAGLAGMVDVAKLRSGGQFDPRVVSTLLETPEQIIAGLGEDDFTLFQAAEPSEPIRIPLGELRKVAEAYADFVDVKSTYYYGHSRKVAGLAFRAAVARGDAESGCDTVFNAALLHDLGKAALPNGILEKSTPLTRYEEMQLHSLSYHTEQILALTPAFDPIRDMACSVEERSDGSGFHRHIRLGEGAPALIAVSNLYDELTRTLPSREALAPGAAAETVLAEVHAGRIPREAARLVLDCAGHDRGISRAALPDGLTPREAEVLRHLARGKTTKEIAQALSVAPKTVDNQTQSIYRKIGTSSRAAAAIYAMENGIFSA
jgi:HD-GYP domain-containing protein (c-di-GMP phosphodiesterase class II)